MKLHVLIALLAFALAACATAPSGRYYGSTYRSSGYASHDSGYGGYDSGYTRFSDCYDRCGVVERIETLYGSDRPSGAGAVIGGVIGGALGNQIGSGSGRTAATVAGAVAGGAAGHAIEREQRSQPFYELQIRLNDGRTLVLTQRDLEGIRPGDRVRLVGGEARLY